MQELKCPKCGELFQIDESGYAAIIKQVRDREFKSEIEAYKQQSEKETQEKLAYMQAAMSTDKDTAVKEAVYEKEAEIAEAKTRIREMELTIEALKRESELTLKTETAELRAQLEKAETELQNEKENARRDLSMQEERANAELQLIVRQKDEEIQMYKDMKSRMSTKMIGESLERHCSTQFDMLRAAAFPNAYFEKDNDISGGTKGDFIFRDYEDGMEYVSIMFEMKNENDETATKHKNEDFFKKLDKDRTEKGCEYAVLVSLLESDSDYYNTGIVDVSHKYPKMYVIRPQFFIPMITLLRNASRNALDYKKQISVMKNQNLDVEMFVDRLNDFKDKFSRNYDLASRRFHDAIDEIDKSIDHLQKIKSSLLASENQLRLANNKAEELTVKKLTKDNQTMREKFEKIAQRSQPAAETENTI